MGRDILRGSTGQDTTLRIIDWVSGLPEEAVDHDTTGLALWYRRQGQAKVVFSARVLSALTDAHDPGGIEHIDDGYYRLDVPDTALSAVANCNHVMIGGTCTSMIIMGEKHPLVAFDPNDIVRMGLTALPDAAADAAGGLPISDAGGLDLDGLSTLLTSILEDTETTLPASLEVLSALLTEILVDTGTTLPAEHEVLSALITAIKTVTDALPNSGALTDLASASNLEVLSALVSEILVDTETTLPASLEVLSALLTAILVDTGTTLPAEHEVLSALLTEILVDTGTTLPASLEVLSALISAILVDTDTTIPASLEVLSALLTAILEDTGTTLSVGQAAIATLVGDLENLSAAEANAEALDVLNVDTYAEPGQGAPGATLSIAAKINFMFKIMRNKIITTSALIKVYDDAGTTVDQKATISDDGTDFTRGKMGSGP